jgi:hypothetical protein
MQPEIHVNFLAIVAAVVSNMVIGSLWYGPLFGKTWLKEMGMPPDAKPHPKVFARAMILMVIGSFLTAYVLAHDIAVWRPSTWKVGADAPDALYGFFAGFFIWVGYYVPVLLSGVAWENKSWKLFGINVAYHLVALQVVAMLLAFWR